MRKQRLEITEVRVWPVLDSLSNLKANARIVLNGSLVLAGLKVVKGKFGHFLAFPRQAPGLPYRYFDTPSIGFRKAMQEAVLHEYAKALSQIPAAA